MEFKQGDDFWNETSGNKFLFDDEMEGEIELDTDKQHSIFDSTLEVSSTLPLHSVISPKNLDLILDDICIPDVAQVAPKKPEKIIQDLCRGQDCLLTTCKSQADKLDLLDHAIKTNDGNIIMKVVLFLSKTFKQNLLYRHLAARPVALQQYANFLARSNKLHDLELLYMACDYKNGLSNLFYLSTQNTSANYVHKRLSQFHVEHLDFLIDDYEKSIFIDHKRFLDYQIANNLNETTPAGVFAGLCQQKLDTLSANNADLQNCMKMLKISHFKSEWIMVNVAASSQKWDCLEDIFQKEKWYSLKGRRKCNVPAELLVYNLHKHGAPVRILEDFLKNVDDSEKAVFLGKRYKCHAFVIDALLAKKDHIGFVEYKNRIMSDPNAIDSIPKGLFADK